MYDIKSYYNSAKNMVLNVPEMEAKVREATNEDAWYVDLHAEHDTCAHAHVSNVSCRGFSALRPARCQIEWRGGAGDF
jgi:hypothetical protein